MCAYMKTRRGSPVGTPSLIDLGYPKNNNLASPELLKKNMNDKCTDYNFLGPIFQQKP